MIISFTGTVRHTEPADQGLVVTLAAAVDAILVHEETTIVHADGCRARAAEIVPGMKLQVRGRDDGSRHVEAQEIIIVPVTGAEAVSGSCEAAAPARGRLWRRLLGWWRAA